MEESMPARMDRTTFSVGLIASVVGIGMLVASPADAGQKYRQQSSYGTPGVYRSTPSGNVVCWTPCGEPGAMVMDADADPFIRQQVVRGASGFFRGGGRHGVSRRGYPHVARDG